MTNNTLGMTDHDREQMRIGTIKVREQLGSSVSATDAQIQEALWHYYYDVAKSVSYLKSREHTRSCSEVASNTSADKHAPAPTQPKDTPKKQPKAQSKFDQAANAAAVEQKPGKQSASIYKSTCAAPSLFASTKNLPTSQHAPLFPIPMSANDFFWDAPWGGVAPHRLATITIHPRYPNGGLLGGSSKLAALAAKRKKQQEEAKQLSAANDTKSDTDAAVALLDKLNVKDRGGNTSIRSEGGENRRPTRYPTRKRSPSPKPVVAAPEESPPEPAQPIATFPDLRASPSTFASTLCGNGDAGKGNAKVSDFPLPYSNLQDYQQAKPFSGPSPDDVVLRAQAKGAGRG